MAIHDLNLTTADKRCTRNKKIEYAIKRHKVTQEFADRLKERYGSKYSREFIEKLLLNSSEYLSAVYCHIVKGGKYNTITDIKISYRTKADGLKELQLKIYVNKKLLGSK